MIPRSTRLAFVVEHGPLPFRVPGPCVVRITGGKGGSLKLVKACTRRAWKDGCHQASASGPSVLLIPCSQDDAHPNFAREPSSGHLLTPYLTVMLNVPRRKWVNSAADLPNVYLPMDQFGYTWCKHWPHPVPPSQNLYGVMLDTPFFVPTRWARAFLEHRT